MKTHLTKFSFALIFLFLIFANTLKGQQWTADEKDLIKTVEQFLFFAGNYNIDAMSEMITDKANLGIVRFKDETRVTTTMTIEEFYEAVKKREVRPYFEPVSQYTIHVDDEHLAFVRADAILYAYGIPQSHNIDYFTLLKENGDWKFINLSYSATPIPEAEKKFDPLIFGKSYAQAWCSQRPEFVSLFFAEDGSLTVNDGNPATGREEISKLSESFMTAFPDIIVTMDSLVTNSDDTEFHWTFTGTNTGPSGSGKKVKIKGVELWQFDDNGLIKESKGSFDTEEYERQIKYGVEN